MISPETTEAVEQFRRAYCPTLAQLAGLLDEAGISHYSSGCGVKRVTFDIFPASDTIRAFEKLLVLDRAPVIKLCSGFKDAKGDYNPAHEFLAHLARWSEFSQQAMASEGETSRGVAAGRAKLLIDQLLARLSEGKTNGMLKTAAFSRLMATIAAALAGREQAEAQSPAAPKKLRAHHNYLKALAAAQNAAA